MKLRRFWIEFDLDLCDWSYPSSLLRPGCGVTGLDLEDCLELIRQQILKGETLPPVKNVVEDVDVSNLDVNHVLPNIGLVIKRGIWFPRMDD
jgi:hypothetical protein